MGKGLSPCLTALCFAVSVSAGQPRQVASDHVASGMQRFRDNQVAESIAEFDRAIQLDPRIAPRLWQRGISLYYSGLYEKGRRQFESHQTVNPNDVENAAWHFVCVARSGDVDLARASLIGIDTRRDKRVPMAEVYQFYAGRISADDVLKASEEGKSELARMYAHLYLGLYYEVAENHAKAKDHMRKAAAAKLRNHYMHDVAKVHLRQRKWDR